MHHLLGSQSAHALAILRIVAGFVFLCHGAQKFGLIQDPRVTLAAPRPDIAQQQLPQDQRSTDIEATTAPAQPAVLFCLLWLYLATRPAGRFSLDNVFFKRRGSDDRELSRLARAS